MGAIGYYPGCSLKGTAAEYELSLKLVAGKLGVELREVPEWSCCGATSAHATDHTAALVMAADTLAKAKRAGIEQVLAPCAMCFQRLAAASYQLGHDAALKKKVVEALGEPADLAIESVRPVNVLDWLETAAGDAGAISKPLQGLKVACYYGCLLVRPPKITGAKEVETPRSMEKIVERLGGAPVRWSMALECCGASFALSRKEVVIRQGQRIYDAAKGAGAAVICLACPMCQANLDMRQGEMGIAASEQLPVVYLTQLLGLAMGAASAEVGLGKHFVPFKVQ